jgi:hypothetical protein
MAGCGVGLSGSGEEQMTGCCEHNCKSSDFIKYRKTS